MLKVLAATLLLAVVPAAAQTTRARRPRGLAARIVVIRPKEGRQQQFEEGYRRHLDWHRANKDPWVWYGWQVVGGERLGYFIDGTFGRHWEDFDAAVSPAADAADNAANVAPYGDFLSVAHYALLPDLGRDHFLEEGRPSPFVELRTYRVRPGREAEFEEALRGLRATASARRYACYKLVNGGEHATYLLFLPHDRLSGLGNSTIPLAVPGGGRAQPRAAKRWQDLLGSAVEAGRSELLRYRPDLSYFPARD